MAETALAGSGRLRLAPGPALAGFANNKAHKAKAAMHQLGVKWCKWYEVEEWLVQNPENQCRESRKRLERQ